MFFLLYRHTDDGVFDNFPKISDHAPKISKIVPKATRTCRTFPKTFRRLSKTFEEDPKMFWPYTNEFKYILRDKLDISEIIDIFTSDDMEDSRM